MKIETANPKPFPARMVATLVALSIGLLMGLGWHTWNSYQQFKKIQEQDFRLQELAGIIVHLDEVLTMSARMAAATGELEREGRYRSFEPQLDAVIKESIQLAPRTYDSEAAARTDAANVHLVEMENRVFALVRGGEREAAAKLLSSEEYAKQKRIYSQGIQGVAATIKQRVEADTRAQRGRLFLSVAAIAVSVLALIFAWIRVLRIVQKYLSERERAEVKTRLHLQRITALQEINVATTSTLDLHAVLNVLMGKIEMFLPYAALLVWLVNQESGLLERAACWNLDEKEWKGRKLSGTPALVRAALEGKAPVAAKNIQSDPRALDPEFYRREKLISYLGVPLMVKGEVLGVLVFLTREEHEFSQEEIEFLSTLAGQAAIAIHNSQLHEEVSGSKAELESTNQRLEKSLRELSGLRAALSPLARAESLGEFMDKVIERLVETTGADAAMIQLRDPKASQNCASQRGFPEDYLQGAASGPPGSALKQVFHTGEPILAPDMAADSRLKGKAQAELGLRSCAVLPLKVRHEVRGILHLASRQLGFFDEEQREHLMVIARQMGIALENYELFQESQQRAEEQATLSAIAMAAGRSLDLRQLFEIVLDKMVEVTGRERVNIRLKDSLTGEVSLFAYRGFSNDEVEKLLHRAANPMTERVFASGQPLIVNDAGRESFPNLLERTRSVAWIPMKAGSKVVGILGISDEQSNRFSPDEIKLLEAIGNVLGVAIENARLFQETAQRAREQETLNAIAKATSQSLRLDELLQTILEKVLEVTGRERVSVRLKNPVTGEIALAAHRGFSREEIEDLLRWTPHRATEQVLATGEPFVINSAIEAPREQSLLPQSRSVAWIPIKSGVGVVGVLGISASQPVPFSPPEVELLQAIGNIIGVAVNNARLFEESQRQQEIQKLLKELSQDITSLDLDSLLRKLTGKVREVLNVDVSDVRVEENQGWRVLGVSGIEPERIKRSGMRNARGRSAWIIENHRPLSIADIRCATGVPSGEILDHLGMRGYLGVPLFSRGGEVMGILRALTYRPSEFTRQELDLLQQLANGAAVALENAQLLEQTRKQSAELEKANKIQADFTAMIAHDLRAPLMNIIVAADMVKEGHFGPVNEEQKKWLSKLRVNGCNLVDLVSDFLDVSKMEAGHIEITKEEVDLRQLIQNSVEDYLPLVEGKNISITNTVPSAFPRVKADSRRLSQVLSNLLSNAAKFTGDGGRIEVGAAQVNGTHVKVWVKDDGMGIP